MTEKLIYKELIHLYSGNPLAAIDVNHVVSVVTACISNNVVCKLPKPFKMGVAYIQSRPKGKALRWRKHHILMDGTSSYYVINTDVDYHDACVEAIDLSPFYHVKTRSRGYVFIVIGPHFPKGSEGYFMLTKISLNNFLKKNNGKE